MKLLIAFIVSAIVLVILGYITKKINDKRVDQMMEELEELHKKHQGGG